MLTSRWKAGGALAPGSPVLVSVTEFTAHAARDLPRVHLAGLRLRRAWPDLPGAVGMWLWTAPSRLRCGSIAVWRDEAALREFVGWAPHVEIMRRFRGRGAIRSVTWEEHDPTRDGVLLRAGRFLAGAQAEADAAAGTAGISSERLSR